ncbi:MAG TPA: hypothetical protein VFF00_06730, partial [Candidatus Elarobacter sp.]|nr:hypothetical protein [Candidatus Elarobacter sp.]
MRATVAASDARSTIENFGKNALVVVPVLVPADGWMSGRSAVRVLRMRFPRIDVNVDLSHAGEIVDDVVVDRFRHPMRIGHRYGPVHGDGERYVERASDPPRLHAADAGNPRRFGRGVHDRRDDRRIDGVHHAREDVTAGVPRDRDDRDGDYEAGDGIGRAPTQLHA